MIQYLIVMLIALMAALIFTPIVRKIGEKIGALDKSDGFRKTHGRPVPRIGGVAIFSAFLFALLICASCFGENGMRESIARGEFRTFIIVAAGILLVGLLDDIFEVKARWKFLAQLAVAVSMYVAGFRIASVSNPFGESIALGWFSLPLTLFWFLGCMNAINLIDGLDGLASGVTLFAVGAVFATGILFGNFQAAILCAAFMGALLGFLWYNFYPASIFLGDSGSYLLGFFIATISLEATRKSHMVFALMIPIIALGIPVIDTALAIVRRWSRSLPMSAADRQHLHHKLRDMGLSHRNAVLVIYAGCLVLAAASLSMVAAKNIHAAAILLAIGMAAILAIHAIGVPELSLALKRVSCGIKRRMRCGECRTAVYEAVERMNQADSVESIWDIFSNAASVMALYDAALTVDPPLERDGDEDGGLNLEWRSNGRAPAPANTIRWSSTFPLQNGAGRVGELKITKSSHDLAIDAALPHMIQPLCQAIADNVTRLRKESGNGIRRKDGELWLEAGADGNPKSEVGSPELREDGSRSPEAGSLITDNRPLTNED